MDLLSILLLIVHVSTLPRTSLADDSSCVAKCPFEILTGWVFIPNSDGYGDLGTACDYRAPCTTQGLGYYTCSYWRNGTLDADGSFGEECGPGNIQYCPSTTRVYCPPPAGVSCTVTCPSTDGWGDALIDTQHTIANTTTICEYFSSVQGEKSHCYYYSDTGGLALDNMIDPEGLKTCPTSATVTCTTSTATGPPTPTPSTPCAAQCPNGGCKVTCPEYDEFGFSLIFTDDGTGDELPRFYGIPSGKPRTVCEYNTHTGSVGGGPWLLANPKHYLHNRQ